MNPKDAQSMLAWMKEDLNHLHYEECRRLNDLIWKGKPAVYLNLTVSGFKKQPVPPIRKKPAPRRLTGLTAPPFNHWDNPLFLVAVVLFLIFLAYILVWVATHTVA